MGNIFNHARRGMAKSNKIEMEHSAFFFFFHVYLKLQLLISDH